MIVCYDFWPQINYDKCELIGIRLEGSIVIELAEVFGCKVGKLPLNYLGLLLCMAISKSK